MVRVVRNHGSAKEVKFEREHGDRIDERERRGRSNEACGSGTEAGYIVGGIEASRRRRTQTRFGRGVELSGALELTTLSLSRLSRWLLAVRRVAARLRSAAS